MRQPIHPSRRTRRKGLRAAGPGIVLAAVLCLLFGLVVAAQNAPARRTGSQGTSKVVATKVAISFAAPNDYAATTDYLKKIAAANPGLTELVEIGPSAAGRPILVLVVSNMHTGVTMDTVVPLRHPRTPAVNNVIPMKPYQGKPGQWIDGGTHADRTGAQACLYIIDKLISGYGHDAEITGLVDDKAFYICPFVNPDSQAGGSGKTAGSDAVASNFPEGWWKDDQTAGGSGEFPSSLPEAHAILEFFTNHTNILLVQSFDVTGGFGLRPFGRWPDSRVDARDVAVFDTVIGKKYQELVGQPGSAQAWRSAYSAAGRQQPAGYGLFMDWAYGQFGAFAVSAQLGPAQNGASLEKLCDTAWQFERYKATLLPSVSVKQASARVLYTTDSATRAVTTESGDAVLVRKSGSPGRYKVMEITATLENSGALPTAVAQGPQLRGNRQDVVWLLGDPSKVTFLQGARWQPLGILDGTIALPRGGAEGGRGGRGAAAGRGGRGRGGQVGRPLTEMREQRPQVPTVRQTGNTRTVAWLVAVEGDTPLKVAVTSQKGGTSVRDLDVPKGENR